MSPRSTSTFLPSVSEADHLFLEDATSKLRSTLRLPATNPVVSRWLFSNPSSSFHADALLLPPSTFSDALVLRISQDVTSFTPISNPFATPLSTLPSPEPPRTNSLHLLLVPAATTDGLVLGYSVAIGAPFDEVFFPFASSVPFSPRALMRGRFAFCPKQKHMVCVVHDLSPDIIGIIGLDWLENNRRNRYFFTVPNQPYDFHNLPTTVLALLKNVEYKIAGAEREWFAPHPRPDPAHPNDPAASAVSFGAFLDDDDNLREETAHLKDVLPKHDAAASWSDGCLAALGGLPDADTNASTCAAGDPSTSASEWEGPVSVMHGGEGAAAFGHCGRAMECPAAGVVSTRVTDDAGSASGAFNMTSMLNSLLDLERTLEGRFFAPRMSRDIMNPFTGEITSRTTGEMRASLQLADVKDAQMLRELTAQSYYATTLAATTDRLLTYPKKVGGAKSARRLEAGGERGGGEISCGAGEACVVTKRPRLEREEVMLEPRTVPLCANCKHLVEERVLPAAKDAEAVREAKKEAKRRKNRLSAARSNQKKKERIETQRNELLALKERLVKLQEAEKTLITENSNLRQQCAMQE